jgi:hypothetical protein
MSTKKKAPVKLDSERPKAILATPKKWDGDSLYLECKKQGIYPSFDSGNFSGYMDKATGKKVTTTLPPLSGAAYEQYKKAEKQALEAAKVEKALKTAKPKKEKSEKAPRENKEGARTRSTIDVTKKIHILAKENPKRDGSRGHAVFAKYKDGMTVAEFIGIADDHRANLNWDLKHGFVELK